MINNQCILSTNSTPSKWSTSCCTIRAGKTLVAGFNRHPVKCNSTLTIWARSTCPRSFGTLKHPLFPQTSRLRKLKISGLTITTGFTFDMNKGNSSIIKVIGVGGGGNNALKHMYEKGIYGVDFVIIHRCTNSRQQPCKQQSTARYFYYRRTEAPVPIRISEKKRP